MALDAAGDHSPVDSAQAGPAESTPANRPRHLPRLIATIPEPPAQQRRRKQLPNVLPPQTALPTRFLRLRNKIPISRLPAAAAVMTPATRNSQNSRTIFQPSRAGNNFSECRGGECRAAKGDFGRARQTDRGVRSTSASGDQRGADQGDFRCGPSKRWKRKFAGDKIQRMVRSIPAHKMW